MSSVSGEDVLFEDEQVSISTTGFRTRTETIAASALQSFEVTKPTGEGCLGMGAGVALAIWGTSTSFDILRGQQLWQSPHDVQQVWLGLMVVSIALFAAGIWGLSSKSRTVVAQFGLRVVHLYVSKDHDRIRAVTEALDQVIKANASR